VLQSGETTKVRVSFDAEARTGHVKKKVYITSNDPRNPSVIVPVVVVVAGAVRVVPSDIYLGVVQAGHFSERAITLIFPHDDARVRLVDVSAPDHILLKQGKRVGYRQPIFVGFRSPVGEFDEQIILRFSNNKKIVVSIAGIAVNMPT
jgi:hypothetical protein